MAITTSTFTQVNTGAAANDGTGDGLRTAFTKINSNYSNIASVGFAAANIAVTKAIEISGTIASTSTTTGALVVAGGVGVAGDINVGGNLNVLGALTTSTTNANLVLDPNGTGDVIFSSGTEVYVESNAASTSTTTGALVVTGGLGVSGNAYINVLLSNVMGVATDLTATGNLKANTTVFAGTGTPISYTNPLFVGTSSANTYIQMAVQNLSSGTQSSSDFVATADIGTDTANFIDMGINGSNYAVSTWTISGARDGYVYVNGGNLTLGTDTSATTVKVHVGGTLTGNVVATFNSPETISTSNTSGALVVTGGLGVSGNLSLATQSTSIAPLKFSAGSLLASQVAGAMEYDGYVLTFNANVNLGRSPIAQHVFTSGVGTNTTTSAALFPSANDTITVPVGTYLFECSFRADITSGPSATAAYLTFSPLGSGTATCSTSYSAVSTLNTTAPGVATVPSTATLTHVTSTAQVYVGPISTISTVAYRTTRIRGILRVTAQGTIIPTYGYSTSPTNSTTLYTDNYFSLTPLSGSGSTASVGQWA